MSEEQSGAQRFEKYIFTFNDFFETFCIRNNFRIHAAALALPCKAGPFYFSHTNEALNDGKRPPLVRKTRVGGAQTTAEEGRKEANREQADAPSCPLT